MQGKLDVRRAALWVVCGALMSACDGPAATLDQMQEVRLESETEVRAMAPASAGTVGSVAYLLLTAVRTMEPTSHGCPRVSIVGNTVTLEGGCTDENGVLQRGRLSVAAPMPTNGRPGEGDATVRSEGLGTVQDVECGGRTYRVETEGELRLDASTRGAHTEYEFLYVTRGATIDAQTCEVRELRGGWNIRGSIEYVDTGAAVPRTVHNGEGRFGSAPHGSVRVLTRDEVIDRGACAFEPLSGTTTLTARGRSAVISYDGATQCARDAAASWSLDGQSKGTLTGLACSVGRARGARDHSTKRTVIAVGTALCGLLVLQRALRKPPRR